MSLRKLDRWYHTLRPLRFIQWTNRVARKLQRPDWNQVAAPPRRVATGRWSEPAQRPALMTKPDELRVFETSHRLAVAGDWHPDDAPHLVIYNLHYFDDLNASGSVERKDWHRQLIERWIVENPPGRGAGWEPYPLSIRVVNWIKWDLRSRELGNHELDSLATQAHALSQQIEYHLLANHLFANAKALTFAGSYFEGDQAAHWLQTGAQLLERELREQVLADGAHFELSPMYHATILEDLLDLVNLSRVYPNLPIWNSLRPLLETKISAMRKWLGAMCHPDGEISFFNDAAFGVAVEPLQLDRYAARLNLPSIAAPRNGITFLDSSGYVRLQSDESVVILDVAEVGPSYQPGHAHADTLSWEWSWRGQRVVVNSGTSCYGVSAERHRQRSTAAHNSVVVNGENSSDVWSGFRVGRRAHPGPVEIDDSNGQLRVKASHDGYRRRDRLVHCRQWTLGNRLLKISDRLEGRFHQAESRTHLHPQATTSLATAGCQIGIQVASAGSLAARINPGDWILAQSTYHPRFEVSQHNECLVGPFHGPVLDAHFQW